MLPANLPFRIGTTSYIIPADILPNVRYLVDKVNDIQLVLFELDDDQSNLPNAAQVGELNELAVSQNLSYSVHLPLDLRLGTSGENLHISLEKARRVIESTRDLNPRVYVAHLDGKEERNSNNPDVLAGWRHQAVESLRLVAEWTGDIQSLAVENLEGYPLDLNDAVIAASGASRCIDIGHLWLDNHDPLAYFPARLEQTSIIHLHGIKERDHQSLGNMSNQCIDDVFTTLFETGYNGIVTLEVFSEEDFHSSMQTVSASIRRIWGDR